MVRVSLYTSPAILPFSFAVHTWFVIETPEGVSRWEVGWKVYEGENHWGHLLRDDLPPTSGIRMFPFSQHPRWKGKCIGNIEGATAEQIAAAVFNSPDTYPWKDTYRLLGPNSNSYPKWILQKFPDCTLRPPWNAFG